MSPGQPTSIPAIRRIAGSAIFLFACAGMSLLIWNRPELLISADSLLPAAFVRDLAFPAHIFLGFQQARVPSFFPDLLVFAPAQWALGWRGAMAAWTFAMLAGLAWTASRIAARISAIGAGTAALPVLAVFMAIMAAAAWNAPRFDGEMSGGNPWLPYLGTTMPYAHGGPFVLALATAAAAMRAAGHPGREAAQGFVAQGFVAQRFVAQRFVAQGFVALGLFGLSFALGLSDLLCVTSLVAPLTLALAVRWSMGTVSWRRLAILLPSVWAGTGLGWGAALFLERQPLALPSAKVAHGQIIHFLADLASFPGPAAAAFVMLTLLAHRIWRDGMRPALGQGWAVFAVTAAAGSVAAMTVNYRDVFSTRYALPLYWWTAILAASALATLGRRASRMAFLAAAAALALTQGAIPWRIPALLVWDTPIAACLRNTETRAGLADYWNARVISAASGWALQVEQITEAGEPYIWGNNPYWFTHDRRDTARAPPFHFIVMERLSRGHIAEVFGPPDRVVTCGTIPVWIYDRSASLTRPLTDTMAARAARAAAAVPGWRARIIRFVTDLTS